MAAFTPWNWPVQQTARKIAPALAAGCSIIVKGPEETPTSTAEFVKAFDEAGIPKGTLNLVFGIPSEISKYLIPHPIVKKVTFTGSTQVGKQLMSLAGLHMKKVTMELGGHSPAIICEDANIESTRQKFNRELKDVEILEAGGAAEHAACMEAVSYTHLTLPTKA